MPTERKINLEWLNIALTAVTLLAMIGGWLWWGGRLSARVENLESFKVAMEAAAAQNRETDSQQTSAIAVTNAQYSAIATQLNRLESKVDVLR